MKRIFSVIVLICIGSATIAQQEVKIPDNLQATEIDDYSALLTWNKDDGILKYIVSYNVAMSENVIEIETFDTSYYINNLLSATQYLWKVRAISVDMDTSEWSNLSSFYTAGYNTDCAAVNHLIFSTLDNNDILVQWTGNEDCLYWEVVCDDIGSNPDNVGRRFFTKDMEYSITGLDLGLSYQIAVRAHCNASFSNWKYMYAKFTQSNTIPELPVEITFEDPEVNNSVGIVSSNTNIWVIGDYDDCSAEQGGHSLYVSNDNAQSATFNNEKKSISYAYIDFLPQEDITGFYLDFMYKSNLNSLSDGMKIFLISSNSNLDIDSLTDGVYQVGKTIYNNTEGQWKKEHIEFSNQFAGSQRKMVFAWINSDTCQDNNSVLLDSIVISARYCPVPDSVKVSSITYNSAEISWNLYNNQTSFNLQYCKTTDTVWKTEENIFNHYVIENLEENTSYFFRLQANCSDEKSFYSQMYEFKTEIYLTPVDINSLQYEVGYDNASFTWENAENVKYYNVAYKENSENAEWITQETPVNSCIITNLTPNTEYLFKLRYITMQDKISKYTDEIMFATICAPVTDFPYLMSEEISYNSQDNFSDAQECFDTSLSALISPVFDISELETAQLNFDIMSNSSVSVYISNDGGQAYKQLAFLSSSVMNPDSYSAETIILSDYIMENNIRIKFIFNTTGGENISAKIRNIAINNACKAPRSINIDDIDSNYVTVSWNESDFTTSWIAKIYDEEDNMLKSLSVSENSCTFSGLQRSSLYKIVIKSYCSETESYDSLYTYITTLGADDGLCHAPANFKAYQFFSKADETILATWEAESGHKIWEVWYKDVYAFDWNQKTVTVVPSFSIRNLKEGEQYEIKVRTICAPGDTSDFTRTDTVIVKNSSLISAGGNLATVNIFPNPTANVLNLDCGDGKITDLYVISEEGKVMKFYPYVSSQIDLSDLTGGIYTLLGNINGSRFRKIVIKQ